jgi:alpha/beta superfamily hydrolase
VVYRIARGLRRTGHAVLRFNYRGVNLSEGAYAQGEGEMDDARAALAYLRGRYPELPYTLAGFSFGSRIALRLGCGVQHGDASESVSKHVSKPSRIVAVGFPTEYRDRSSLEGCGIPRVFIQSTHDEFGAVEDLRATVESLPEPETIDPGRGAGSFLCWSAGAAGRSDRCAGLNLSWGRGAPLGIRA